MVLKKKSVDIMDAPDTPANLTLHFEAGIPVRVVNEADGVDITGPLELFSYLNEVRWLSQESALLPFVWHMFCLTVCGCTSCL